MSIFAWIVLGLIAGWIGSKIVNRRGEGFFLDIVLGVVGAGGIGQELKNSVDLLDFARLFTIILIILAMVTAIDQFSAWLRRKLV